MLKPLKKYEQKEVVLNACKEVQKQTTDDFKATTPINNCNIKKDILQMCDLLDYHTSSKRFL